MREMSGEMTMVSPGSREGRQLVGKGFTPAGGHQHKSVPPAEYLFDNLKLTGAKGVMTEILFENVFGAV